MSEEPVAEAENQPEPAPAIDIAELDAEEEAGDIPDTPPDTPNGLDESGMWDTAGNAIVDGEDGIPGTPTGEGEDAIPSTPKGEDAAAGEETKAAAAAPENTTEEPVAATTDGEATSTTPAAEEPKVEEPAAEEPKVEEPAAEEPKVEEPAAEEPKVEEPAAEEPKVEEPAAEEPKVEEPAVEEPKVEEPAAESGSMQAATNEPLGIDAAMEDESFVDGTGTTIAVAGMQEHPGLLQSPRCVEAMKTQGIQPRDLAPRPLASFKPVPPLMATKEQQQMRSDHFEKRRIQKCNLVLSTRHELMQLQAAGKWPPPKPADDSELSTMIVKERERAALAKKRMIDRNMQLKAHEDKRSELRAQKLVEIDFVEKREKERKEQAKIEAQKAEKERELRALEFKAIAKAKQREVEVRAEAKRAEAKIKAEEKIARQNQRKKEKAEIQAEKTAAAQKRIEAVLEADKRNIQKKHERAEQKKAYLAQRQKENERLEALEQKKRDEEAAVKAAKIEACREREREVEAKRLSDFDAKKMALLQRMEEKNKLEEIAHEEHERQVEIKHQHQLAARTEAADKKARTRQDRMEKQQNKELQYQEMMEELNHSRLIASENKMLEQLDRQDFRERHDRIAEKQRQEALAAINMATDITEARKRDQNQLLQERQEQRKLAHFDKGQMEIDNSTPGPGEYNTEYSGVVPCAVIAKKLPMEPENIPGPSAYDVNHSQVLTYGGTIVMGQTKNVTALDKHVNYYGKIPASNAYDIDRDLNAPSVKFSTGNQPGDIELRMKIGAKIPAPHDYSPTNYNFSKGTTFGKAALPDPQDTPQRENPSPFVYKVNMESVWAKRPNPDCNTAGEKTYLEGLQLWASKLPGPGTYQVSTESASGIGEGEDFTASDKRQIGSYMEKMLEGRWSAKHTPLDCARLTPPKASVL